MDGKYFEKIPSTRAKNYFRDGVRVLSAKGFEDIVQAATPFLNVDLFFHSEVEQGPGDFESEIIMDGGRRKVFSTRYERNKVLRDQAIKIHGLTCKGCGTNFRQTYGVWGDGFIHVHHKNPVSGGKQIVRPETDLIVVCANCHSMIHRKKNQLLTIEEVQQLVAQNRSVTAP
jgi:5-methylcytosine-specific restriction protein A